MSNLLEQDFGSSDSEGEDFNPAQHVDSDEDDVKPVKRRAKRASPKPGPAPDSDDEKGPTEDVNSEGEADDVEDDGGREAVDEDDIDEEDEDDEEDEEGPQDRQRHKRRRLQFIDEEAEVDDEDEEEELDEDELPLLDEAHPDDAADLPAGAEHDDRRHRELDRQRERQEDLDAEKQAELLRQRYGRQRATIAEASGIPQHLLLPSVDDPSIWAVRCKPGKENEVVNSIMKRFAERIGTREALGISSCFARESSMAGYIYVEARRQPDVLTAIDNVNFCYANHIQLIPVNEMPQLLKVKKPKEIKEGSFVRMKRPAKYAGDLAQIVEIEINANEVRVRLVPRIEYGSTDMNGSSAAKRKRPGNVRPPVALFNENEAKKEGRYFVPRGKARYEFHGEDYENGYLIKTFKISAIQLEDVNPTLEEATKFSRGTENGDETRQELDLSSLAATLKSASAVAEFLPGDMVEIFTGEQKGVKGRAAAVLQDIVSIDVTEGVLHGQKIDAPAKTLRKMFKEGDHVKVLTHSKYYGETGLVLKIKDDRVTLLTNANNAEITVFSKDLRVALDSGGLIGISKFDLYDLVELDAATVACVIKVDRETVRVIDQNGSVRTLLPSSISSKLDKKRQTVATDREGTEIRTEDLVKEPSGQQREGEVIHIHRNYLFLMNRQMPENSGIFVVKSASVQIKSAKGARTIDAPDITKMNPALMGNASGNRGAMAPPPKMQMGRDHFEGKEVLVTRGPQKGLRGRVKDSTSTHLRLELESKPGVHTYPKEILKMKDGSGQWVPLGTFPGRRMPVGAMNPPGIPSFGGSSGGIGSSTPQRMPVGARTPSGGRTPMGPGPGAHGGRTPAWGLPDGGRTPGWEREKPRPVAAVPDGGRTPGWQRDGGRTPAWMAASSRTPAWQAGGPDGSRTAYGGVDYGSGSKTPAYSYPSAPTPSASYNSWGAHAANAATPAVDAPTPGGMYLSAPTPGASADAPTPRVPGASNAYTPGQYGGGQYGQYGTPAASAPTPRAFAETPGAYSAETPGAYAAETPYTAETPAAFGDDDEGPRYD